MPNIKPHPDVIASVIVAACLEVRAGPLTYFESAAGKLGRQYARARRYVFAALRAIYPHVERRELIRLAGLRGPAFIELCPLWWRLEALDQITAAGREIAERLMHGDSRETAGPAEPLASPPASDPGPARVAAARPKKRALDRRSRLPPAIRPEPRSGVVVPGPWPEPRLDGPPGHTAELMGFGALPPYNPHALPPLNPVRERLRNVIKPKPKYPKDRGAP